MLQRENRHPVTGTLSQDAKRFYTRNGFIEPPLDSMALVVALQDATHCL